MFSGGIGARPRPLHARCTCSAHEWRAAATSAAAHPQVVFKVKRSTKFEKVISAFCDKKSWDVRSVKFLFDGQRIQPEQTPADFEMVRDRSASRPPAGLARASGAAHALPGWIHPAG